jgi:glycosyltransferase involved in cell wall biosynthesis
MKKEQNINTEKLSVTYFQRKPRAGNNFSIEVIFENVRKHLADKIHASVKISSLFNEGFFTKFINIFEAALRQSNSINHITGEVHFLNLLMRKKTVLLTIHDCGMMTRKTGIAKKIVNWLYLKAPVKNSRFVTAVSNTTRQEIIYYTGCKSDKIIVIPVAVDLIYQPFPKIFNAIKPNLLHIGTAPNKNLLRLIYALEDISCHLTIIGRLDTEIMNALAQKSIDYSNFYNVSPDVLLQKYHECDILTFISTFEGFGMPVIEANSVERVVITSNVSSMPEIAGNAACLVDPFNIEEIKTGLLKIIEDEQYRNQLIVNGRSNKLRFDPYNIAGQYYTLYKEMWN